MSSHLRFFNVGSLLLACSSVAIVSCSGGPQPESIGQQESADEIAPFDDPSGLLGQVSTRLADNIVVEDVGMTFGTPDEEVPYPDTYWPMTENGIDVQWNDDQPSPLEKYMKFADPANLEAARAWNRANHGEDVPGVQSWFGICHGWSGAAVFEKPVVRGVRAKVENNDVKECAPEDTDCTEFAIGDVNGLLAEVYSDARSRFIGARCDTSPADIVRDENGRIDRERNGRGCKGLNPGSLLVVMSHRMKRDRKALVIDAQSDYNTDQIWNQPAYRYTVNRYEVLTEAEAANLVGAGSKGGELTEYRWNDRANGFVLVDLTIHWVSEDGPNVKYVSGLESTVTTRMVAVVELDKEPTDESARIIGGEYLDDSSAYASRLRVPPFVWLTVAPGPEQPFRWRGHNPYLKTSLVRKLAALGQR